eukprot:g1122.t1
MVLHPRLCRCSCSRAILQHLSASAFEMTCSRAIVQQLSALAFKTTCSSHHSRAQRISFLSKRAAEETSFNSSAQQLSKRPAQTVHTSKVE